MHRGRITAFYRQNLFFCNFLLAWSLLFSLLCTAQHFSFATSAWDLSIFDYAMSSTLKGDIMAEPFHYFGWGSHLAIHFTPVLFFLVPLYLVFKGPLFLLYIQVLAVGLAAIPLYLIAKHKFPDRKIAVAAAFVFLTYRPLLTGLMYDFHPEMFYPLFIFASYYFLAIRNKKTLFFLSIFLALAIKEDFAVYTFFYCLWLARKKEWKKSAAWAMLGSALYILLTFAVFIPFFRGQVQVGQTYEFISKWRDYGHTPLEIFKHALARPLQLLKDLKPIANLGHLANYFLPLLCMPLGSSAALLLLPPLAIGWGSRIPTMASFGLHYGAALIPFLFLALLLTWQRLHKAADKAHGTMRPCWQWLVVLIVLVNLSNFKWNLFTPGKYQFIHEYPSVKGCLLQIPAAASLAAQSALIPHIAKRKAIFMLPATGEAEYILLHLRLNPWPMSAAQLQELDASLRLSPKYSPVFSCGYLHLYKKTDQAAMPQSGEKR
ncbi:MAG: DUF2079 domain-containing protein [Candidatus Aminicenantes bacterium]|nr:DUF2079 domain-containing protein [Candidatus Aminicenantes bacterium]